MKTLLLTSNHKYNIYCANKLYENSICKDVIIEDVFIHNKKNTSKMIDHFIENLEDLKKAIQNEDGKKLEEIFTKTKKIREEIVKAGQDVGKPDFGRK